MIDIIKITDKDFSVEEIIKKMKKIETGCIVSFIGIVRGVSNKKHVKRIEIEVYKKMANKKLCEIEKKAKDKYKINNIYIIHRIGKLNVSENIIYIGVSAPHRDDVFNACEWIINEIKKEVPIWKKEIYER